MNNNFADNSKALEFVCLCCGTCCKRYQPRISLAEANSIAGNLNLSPDEFIKQYTDHRWPGTQSLLIRQVNSACMFLKTSEDGNLMLCSIHSFKPACCLAWQARADREECQEGLKKRWDSGS